MLEKLRFTLEALKAERAQILSQGWYLQQCWLVQVKPGGNARTDRRYWQVRSRQAMFDGKTLRHLRSDEVENYRGAIARGRQLKQIDRQIQKLQQQLAQQNAKSSVSNTVEPASRQTVPTPRPASVPPVGDRNSSAVTQPPTLSQIDLAEQERLVSEVLANTRALRVSLQRSIALGRWLGVKNNNLKDKFPHLP